MHRLHTLGGPNGFANMVNNRAEIVGLAETNAQDRNCPLRQFQPVVWKHGKPYALPTVGDSYGVAAYINDKGQIAGSSGACAPFNFNTLLYMSEDHAMLWVEDGTPHDLGNLGGAGGIAGNPHVRSTTAHKWLVIRNCSTTQPSTDRRKRHAGSWHAR